MRVVCILVFGAIIWCHGLFPLVVPEEEKQVLEPFLKVLLTEETLGYVLLDAKPVALISFLPQLSWRHPVRSLLCLKSYLSKKNQILKHGWEVVERHSNALSEEFLFIKERSPHSPISQFVFIINRQVFCQTVNQYAPDFERVLGRPVTGEELFEEIKSKQCFTNALKQHEGLLGILLGFGRNNAWLFMQGKMKQLGFFPRGKEGASSAVCLPHFRANWKDPETVILLDKYLKCREKIRERFLNDNSLEQAYRLLFKGNECGTLSLGTTAFH